MSRVHVSRKWSVVLVGATSVFLMGLLLWQTMILSQGQWCNRALAAEKLTPDYDHLTGGDIKIDAMTACISLLTKQVNFIGWAHLIAVGVIALSLGVLVVIVLAGARIELEASKSGLKTKVTEQGGPLELTEDMMIEGE